MPLIFCVHAWEVDVKKRGVGKEESGEGETNIVVVWRARKESTDFSQTFVSLSWATFLDTIQLSSSFEGVGFRPNMGAHVWVSKATEGVRRLRMPQEVDVFERKLEA